MKTLINKNNPAIRITAPSSEIKFVPEGDMFKSHWEIGEEILRADDWTLIEEEPKHTEVWMEGRTIFEQDAKKPEVDLEKDEPEPLTPFEEKVRGVILDNARTHYTSTGASGIDVYLTDENIRKIVKQVSDLKNRDWSKHLMDAFKKGDEAGRDYMTAIYPKWRIAKRNCFEDTPCFLVKFRHDEGDYEDWDEVICTNRLMMGEEYIDIAELDHLPKAE